MDYKRLFDVIVVGGGHAGTEAAHASARIGCDTLLVTHSIETLGQMSCNPAIGGIGKSHLVREVDACDGLMAKVTDRAGIQFRILNRKKGPAVRATRAQADRVLYRQHMRYAIETVHNLTIFQQPVSDLIIGKKPGGWCCFGYGIEAPIQNSSDHSRYFFGWTNSYRNEPTVRRSSR